MRVIQEEGSRPIKLWTEDIEEGALQQLKNMAKLPFIDPHGVCAMPDVHFGIGATVGSVIATTGAIIPAAVGVDIGCGMCAAMTNLTASDLPDSLKELRHSIERSVPLGAGGQHKEDKHPALPTYLTTTLANVSNALYQGNQERAYRKAASQLGTLGSGNHFIELCLDDEQHVWVMLHSGSRGTGNIIGRHYIERAKRTMEKYFIQLPDKNLAYFPENTSDFDEYCHAVLWAQDYAAANRDAMMYAVFKDLKHAFKGKKEIEKLGIAVNCHHNYVERENHHHRNVWLTRKGAIRARLNDIGIIPGSMGRRSYIVRGLGNEDSYQSCSHGAGRRMGRKQAMKHFTVEDLIRQTEGVECRKDAAVLDEIPGAYKDIDQVMENQKDLVEVLYTLKQVMCVKGA